MIVRHGRGAPPKGFLPVFSVGSEAEAKLLLVMTCSMNMRGEFVARETAEKQTLERLYQFGRRLARFHDNYIKPSGKCDCEETR